MFLFDSPRQIQNTKEHESGQQSSGRFSGRWFSLCFSGWMLYRKKEILFHILSSSICSYSLITSVNVILLSIYLYLKKYLGHFVIYRELLSIFQLFFYFILFLTEKVAVQQLQYNLSLSVCWSATKKVYHLLNVNLI